MKTTTDFLLIGGGIIGLNVAIAMKKRYPDCTVTLIEKEDRLGLHASGRNSGVLHAGFYYDSDSLKARFSREGNKALKIFCKERKLNINNCGKLVVTQSEAELPILRELLRRGHANGVDLQEIDEKEASQIEPRAKTFHKAIYSPTTASVEPNEVMNEMSNDALNLGITVLTGTRYLGHKRNNISTTAGRISAGYVINAAGLYADKIAMDFGFSTNYRILPFKGLYLYSDEPVGAMRTNVYPVPDMRNPFLGVHFTITATGRIKIGPTAIPAFWREHYNGLSNFSATELIEISLRELGLFISNDFGFRKLAITELAKYYKPRMISQASKLVSGVSAKHFRHWGAPGIRAQLYDIKKRRLENDFRFEGDGQSFHILNAVSPAFTCSIPFAHHVVNEVGRLLSG
jgi:(S)-2-hydroxyglutarate dehydrogenase